MNSLFVANFLKNLPNKAQLVILKKAVTYDKDFQARAKKLRKKKRPDRPVK